MRDVSFMIGPKALSRWDRTLRAQVSAAMPSIDIYDVIGEDPWSGGGVTAKDVSASLEKIGAQDVTVNVNSPGGSFFEGLAIYNLLREHKGNVNVRVLGIAASAASVLTMAGKNIKIASSGFLMIHNAWSLVIGNKADLLSAAADMEKFDNSMVGIYAARSGASAQQVKAWMDAETYFTGQEAVSAKLADSLLDADVQPSARTEAEVVAECWQRNIAARRLQMAKLAAA